MRTVISKLLVAAACLVLACAVVVPALAGGSDAPLTGTWDCVSLGGQRGKMNFTLDLQQDGHRVTGYVSSPIGDATLSSGAFTGNQLTFTIDGDTDQYTLSATLKDGQLAGKWSTNNSGEKGTWTGRKSAAQGQ